MHRCRHLAVGSPTLRAGRRQGDLPEERDILLDRRSLVDQDQARQVGDQPLGGSELCSLLFRKGGEQQARKERSDGWMADGVSTRDGLRWSRKTGQGFKVGSPLMKDGPDDWQTQAVLG